MSLKSPAIVSRKMTKASARKSLAQPIKDSRKVLKETSDERFCSDEIKSGSKKDLEVKVKIERMKLEVKATEKSKKSNTKYTENKQQERDNASVLTRKIKMINDGLKPLSEPTTPRKEKSRLSQTELSHNSVTPPKVRRTVEDVENLLKSPPTPSTMLTKLTLNSPTKIAHSDQFEPKQLFQEHTMYQNARKALHSTVPSTLPGRENELSEMKDFIKRHLQNRKSGSLYVSGPPGTGKTACLSTILEQPEIVSQFKHIYVNCTAIKSSASIFSRIVKELNIKTTGKAEKDQVAAIENYLSKNHKMLLLVLDEIDQLESKKQSILYTIFEWPSRRNSAIILIGIANALDLTDRILPRLQARCELKPQLMHFAPYSKQQIVQIFTERLRNAGVLDVFSPVALQMLAGKVAAVSGDVRRALDIGRRVVEMVEQNNKHEVFRSLENIDCVSKSVDLKQVVNVLNNVYGTTNNLNDDDNDTFPLQQKVVLCTLLLMLKKAKNKDVTVGKLHDVYRKVALKCNLMAIDQAEFVGLCSLIETRGIIRVSGKKEPRLFKISLEWDQEEVCAALKDKQLLSTILQDDSCLGKM